MTPLPTLPAFEARMANVQCRTDAASREELERDGWRVASDPSPWGSVWLVRPVVEPREVAS